MRLPISFSVKQTVVSATTTSGTLIAANPLRKYLAIQNVGATNNVSLNFDGAAAVSGSGWLLAAGGGAYIWEATGVPIQAISVISAAGTSNVVVIEGS